MKKLIILSDMNVWHGNTAGVVRMNNYAKALSDSNKIYLFTSNKIGINNLVEIEKNIFIQKIETLTSNQTNRFNKIKNNLFFAKSVKNFDNENSDVDCFLVYPSTNSSFEFFLFLYLKILSRKTVYYELNEIRKYSLEKVSVFDIKKFIIWIYNLLKFWTISFGWFFYDGIICINKNIADFIHKYNKETVIIPILADIKSIRNENKPSSNNEFSIFFSGSISIRKENLEEFFKGLILFDKICKKWKFELCGPFEGNDKNILLKIIKENNLEHKIIFIGNLPHSEVLRKQQEASLLVLTRGNNKQNYYGFSTKLAEYAVSGTPILLTKTGVVTDFFIDNENCYLVNGYNSQSFFEGLEKIFNSTEEQRNKIAENALKTAKINFDYHNYTEKLENFLFK